MPQSIPKGLTREHILAAIADLDTGIEHAFGKPTGYELLHSESYQIAEGETLIPMGRRLDLTGEQFGELTVLRPGKNRKRATLWWCRCTCGSEREYYTANLRGGLSARCHDCAKANPGSRTHGMSNTSEHNLWQRIVKSGECCKRWQSFSQFFADVGKRPSPKHAFERLNHNRRYSPKNTRWSSCRRNYREGELLTHRGKRQNIRAWAEQLGITRQGLDYRIRKYGIQRALSGDL